MTESLTKSVMELGDSAANLLESQRSFFRGRHPISIVRRWEQDFEEEKTPPNNEELIEMHRRVFEWLNSDPTFAREMVKDKKFKGVISGMYVNLGLLIEKTSGAGTEKSIGGTQTIIDYLTRRKNISPQKTEELLRAKTPEERKRGAQIVAGILFNEMKTQLGIVQDSDIIWMHADISSWGFEIAPGENTTLKALGESLQSYGTEYDDVGVNFLTDLFAISKLINLCGGMEGVQKNAESAAKYLDDMKIHLRDSQIRRILTQIERNYPRENERGEKERFFSEDFVAAFQIYEALSAPTVMDVKTEDGTIIKNYRVRSKYSPVPLSFGGNIGTRYAVRRAITALHARAGEPLFGYGSGLRDALGVVGVGRLKSEKIQKLKGILIADIEANSNALETYESRAGSTQKEKQDRERAGWFAELMVMQWLEGRGYTAEYDAGDVERDESGEPKIYPDGFARVNRFGGSAATYKLTQAAVANSAMMKYQSEGDYTRGDPGPPCTQKILNAPFFAFDDYLYVEDLGDGSSMFGGTLREAVMAAPEIYILEKALNSQKTVVNFQNAHETVMGAIHEGYAFWQMLVKGLGVKFAKMVHVVPGTEGLMLEIDATIEQKLKGLSSGIEYWLFRDNMKELGKLKDVIEKKFPGEEWKILLQEYRVFESRIKNELQRRPMNKSEMNAFADGLGYTADKTAKFKDLYKKLNRIPTRGMRRQIEGWSKGTPGVNDENFVRAAERVFNGVFGIDIPSARKGMYGEFIKEVVTGNDPSNPDKLDWYRAIKQLVLGLSILGTIQLNKEASNIEPNDVLALKASLSIDFHEFQSNMLTVKALRFVRGIEGHEEFVGVGLFEQRHVNALIRNAQIPRGVFVQAEEIWKNIKLIQTPGSSGKH